MGIFHQDEQPRHSKRCKFLTAALKDAFSLLRLLQDSNMTIFHHEDHRRYSKRCKLLAASLKDAFSNCHTFNGRLSTSGPEEDVPTSDFDDEQEVVVSEIRSRAMEKMKRRPNLVADSLSCVFCPSTGELYVTSKQAQRKEKAEEEKEDEREEYFSVGSCLSLCSSAVSREAFLSVKTSFSSCSSLGRVESLDVWKFDIEDFRRRSIIQEFCHCEGWPFGLCKKAVLLPPLPKSPSDSWSWHKATRIAKTPYI